MKWDEALYGNQLLPAAEMKALFESGKLKDGSLVNYAFGWFLNEKAGGPRIISHSGSWPGYVTYIERNVTTHRTIILLQNGRGSIPKKELRLLMDGKPLPQPEFKAIELPEDILGIYEGEYQLMPDMILTITRKGKKLWGQATGQGSLQFYPAAEDKFFVKDIAAHMEFIKEDGRVSKLIWYQGGQVLPAPKIK